MAWLSLKNKTKKELKFALVLSGGGARGAYEAGVMYYLRTKMPKEIAESDLFKIYSGTSVGAINTAFLSATAEDPLYQGAELRKLWQGLRDKDIYRTDYQALTGFLVRSGFFMASQFFGLGHMLEKKLDPGADHPPFPFKSILDTTPFVYFLRRNVAWDKIHRNIQRGILDAATISATHMMSGQLALFVEKNERLEYRRGGPQPTFCSLSPKHVLASAAIPLVFPIIRINREFYGDGSLRQNTPMSPAIHMGANRILVISTHYHKAHRPAPGSPLSAYTSEPALGDILGTLLDSLFMDKLEYDLEQMKRINYLIDDFEDLFGADALDKVNKRRSKIKGLGKEIHEMNRIVPFVISPSQDIGTLASQHFQRLLSSREKLTPMQKFFSRVVEGTPDDHNDLVSYLLFDGDYLEDLLQLGFEDAAREHDHLVNFFSGLPIEPKPTDWDEPLIENEEIEEETAEKVLPKPKKKRPAPKA